MKTSEMSKWVWLSIGLAAGLVIAGVWPTSKAHAVATDRFEGYAMCTAPVDESLEALFVLDALTGELKATAVSQQIGRFTNLVVRNIAQDMQLAPGDQFRFLLVGGGARLVGRAGGINRATISLIYVAEINSGKICVYTPVWGGQRAAAGAQPLLLELLTVIPFRDQALVRPGAGAAPGVEKKP